MPIELSPVAQLAIHDEALLNEPVISNTWSSTTHSGTITTGRIVSTAPSLQSLSKAKEMFAPIPRAASAARLNPAFRDYLNNVAALDERRRQFKTAVKTRLSEQSRNKTLYTREYKTASEYKGKVEARLVVGPLRYAVKQLEETVPAIPVPPAFALQAEQAGTGYDRAVRFHTEAYDRLNRLKLSVAELDSARRLLIKLVLYSCPLTGAPLLTSKRSYSATYTGPLQELINAGAVKDGEGNWYRSIEERKAALQLQEMLVLMHGDLRIEEVTKSQVERGVMRKTADGRDVLLPAGYRAVADYHSGLPDTSYDDHARHVGIELEVNAGSHGSEERNRIAADILLATNRRVKVERDGSVTGFELITGHGKPSSVRQELAALFRQKLLSGFRTARNTGAHVHVTALRDEPGKVLTQPGYYTGLLPIYSALAERTPTSHCRAGMHHGRYSALNLNTGKGTVEFRLFKAQLRLPKLIRNAQFAWAFMELFGQYVPHSTNEVTLNKFLEGVADLPREETLEFRAWLAGRGYKVPHNTTEFRRTYRSLGVSAAMG